jgi:2-methylisocitrate lyase-like PEP mutase family enzyme
MTGAKLSILAAREIVQHLAGARQQAVFLHPPPRLYNLDAMPLSQQEKAQAFRKLHQTSGIFVIPNPWDSISARLLAGSGFRALATSSAAAAATLGKKDGELTREEALAHARTIVQAVDLPVSADLENGFGDSPESVAETIRLAAAAGLAGCTIEDATRDAAHPLYDFNLAVERISAAAEAMRKLPFPFMLTARAHHLLYEPNNLEETLRRLQAYEEAGANVLFAPALPDVASIRTVCSAISAPFNFMAGIRGKSFPLHELANAGVKRVSLATSLYRAAMTGLLDAMREINGKGEFTFVERIAQTADLNKVMRI